MARPGPLIAPGGACARCPPLCASAPRAGRLGRGLGGGPDGAAELRGIRAFHNVCRHRCLKLVDTPGNVGRVIRCPYHSWTYGLDGALHMTPYFGGRDPRAVPAGFDRGEHGLAPVRSATWHDWIFVNLNGAAPPLEDFVAPLRTWLDGLDLTEIHHLATIDLGEIAANWKLLVENFIEPYHVQFVHSTTTEQPLTDHYTINQSGCLGCAVDVYRIWFDQRRGWRYTNPNLEQLGLVQVEYLGLSDLAADDELFADSHPLLKHADHTVRADVYRALLHHMRKWMAIRSQVLDTAVLEQLVAKSHSRLRAP